MNSQGSGWFGVATRAARAVLSRAGMKNAFGFLFLMIGLGCGDGTLDKREVGSDSCLEVGCACDEQLDVDQCIDGKALVCVNDAWVAVEDGPCLPEVPAGEICFSPTQYPTSAYDQGAVGCACDPEVDEDMCVAAVALICYDGRWRGVQDGPCLPPPRPGQ
jgi:hypothetical protein